MRPTSSKRKIGSCLILILTHLFSLNAELTAQEEAFRFFEEEAKVLTASKQLEPITKSPVAVDVITREEIENSGASNIWDLLRFRVGMDVLDGRSADGNRAVVSVRGLPRSYADDLLVLVDGRSVYNAIASGVYWSQIPVQIQDIERIEIVRGPNAALYGSNAGVGVINILTRKSAEKKAQAQIKAGNRGSSLFSGAVENSYQNFHYRLSYGHEQTQGFPRISGGGTHDSLFSYKENFSGAWVPAAGTELELFAGGSRNRSDINFIGSDAHFFTSEHFGLLKGVHRTAERSSLEGSLSGKELNIAIDPAYQGTLRIRERQEDAEIFYKTGWGETENETILGGSYRRTGNYSERAFPGQGERRNTIWRGFARQLVKPWERVSLIGAASLEESDSAGTQPSYQAAVLTDVAQDHTLRASYALAPTIPSEYSRGIDWSFSATGRALGNPNLAPKKLSSYELGYRGSFMERGLLLESNVFYMDINQMAFTVLKSLDVFFSPPFFTQTTSFDNTNAAIARGAEAKIERRWSRRYKTGLNYTYETVRDQKRDEGRVLRTTPEHKFNLNGSVFLGEAWNLAANAGYKDGYLVYGEGAPNIVIPAYWRLDAKASCRPRADWELFVAGQNLTRPYHREFGGNLKIPRTYSVGISILFGGGQ